MGGSGRPCLLRPVNPQVLSLGLDFLPAHLASVSVYAIDPISAVPKGLFCGDTRHLPRRALLSC